MTCQTCALLHPFTCVDHAHAPVDPPDLQEGDRLSIDTDQGPLRLRMVTPILGLRADKRKVSILWRGLFPADHGERYVVDLIDEQGNLSTYVEVTTILRPL